MTLILNYGHCPRNFSRAFNRISAKHFDFVVCAPNGTSLDFVVELDDASHQAKKTVARDKLLNDACQSAGLPLLRIKAARGYAVGELREQILVVRGDVADEPVFA